MEVYLILWGYYNKLRTFSQNIKNLSLNNLVLKT